MPLYEVSWTDKEIGARSSRKIVASGPIAAALKAPKAKDPLDVSVEQLDADLSWSDSVAGGIAAGIAPRRPGARSVKISYTDTVTLSDWLKRPLGNGLILTDGRLVFDPQQDGGMAVRVFSL